MAEATKPIPEDLHAALREAQAALAAARAERGAAKLDGTVFDSRRCLSLESQVDALQHAIGEKTRRERAEAAKQQEALRRELVGRLKEAEAARIDAIATMQQSATAFAEAVASVTATTAEARRLIRSLNLTCPLPLTEGAVERRISNLIGKTLSEVSGHPNKFGDLRWHVGSGASRDWAADERKAGDVAGLIKESGKKDGNGYDRSFGEAGAFPPVWE